MLQDFNLPESLIRDALTGNATSFILSNVEPTAMFGYVAELNATNQILARSGVKAV